MKPQLAQALGAEPGAGQAGGDARGAALAVDAHQRLGRAAGGRPAGLVPQGRGQRHRRAAGVLAASCARPRA
ncbi:MAG: hypothetical protein MZW92_23925 [Comamonadaceae bacterium]|nr:hypothetical protein [Comamonadaceae bacterium]